MKNKTKDLNDVKQITEDYMDYYINFRPQKKLRGVPPQTVPIDFENEIVSLKALKEILKQ